MDIECPICLESNPAVDIMISNCKHHFHKKCIEEWLQYSNQCPYCRGTINNKFNGKFNQYSWDLFFLRRSCKFVVYSNNIAIIIHNRPNLIIPYTKIKTVYYYHNKIKLIVKIGDKLTSQYCYILPNSNLHSFYENVKYNMLECHKKIH